MTDKKFTAADVVVGATVTIQQVTTYPLRTVTATTHGMVREVENGSALITDEVDQERYWIDLVRTPDAITVEILDVQPPKPEYVVGGIYRMTTDRGTVYHFQRYEGGFGPVNSDSPTYSDHDLATREWLADWTVGDRVLVIDYPSDEQVERITSNFDFPWVKGSLSDLVARALKAEAR